MKKRLKALKKDQKGFTLVELIVVLVILAIMAALLVPALLGYIDRARNSKYLEEARSVYTAIQAVNDENYAKTNVERVANGDLSAEAADKNPNQIKINDLIYPTEVKGGTLKYKQESKPSDSTLANYNTLIRDYYTVKGITSLKFKSQDGSTVTVTMDENGNWETETMKVESKLGSS